MPARQDMPLETAWNRVLKIVLADPERLAAGIRDARREFPDLTLALCVMLGYLGDLGRRDWIATELAKRGYDIPRPEPPGDPIATLCGGLPRSLKGIFKNFCNCMAGDTQACIGFIMESSDEKKSPIAIAVGGQFRKVLDCDTIRARYEAARACVCGFDMKAKHTRTQLAKFEQCRRDLDAVWLELLNRGCIDVIEFLEATKALAVRVG